MFTLDVGEIAGDDFLYQFPLDKLIKRIEFMGYIVVPENESDNYVNIEKSMGTESFYDLLINAIEKGELNLELLVGKVALKKIMKSVKNEPTGMQRSL